MKTLLFILSLFSFMPFTTHNEYLNADEAAFVTTKIINSLFKIKTHIRQTNGSGTFIKIHKQDYALTNAHVCLSGELENAYETTIKSKTFKYTIISRKTEIETFIPVEEVVYNLTEDWCIFPIYSNLNFPIIDQSILSEEMTPWVRYLTYNNGEKSDAIATGYNFKACAVHNEFTKFLPECTAPIFPEYNKESSFLANDNKTEKRMIIREGYYYYLPVIPGDSGSPVYNNQNKLVGLITSSTTKNVIVLGAKVEVKAGVVTPIQSFKYGAE